MQDTEQGSWATVAYETFEHNVIPWAGRRYAEWVRAWSRPHPGDPTGLVQVPAQMYAAFQKRAPGERLNRRQAEALGYPGVPGERELDEVRRELHEALGRGDWEQAHDLDMRLRELQERVAEMRVTALRPAGAQRIRN
jgi:hypothetical protein